MDNSEKEYVERWSSRGRIEKGKQNRPKMSLQIQKIPLIVCPSFFIHENESPSQASLPARKESCTTAYKAESGSSRDRERVEWADGRKIKGRVRGKRMRYLKVDTGPNENISNAMLTEKIRIEESRRNGDPFESRRWKLEFHIYTYPRGRTSRD